MAKRATPEGREPGKRTRGARKWRIPPAIRRGAGETIDHIAILEEHEPELALALWRTVRDVELWADAPRRARTRLFGPAAGERRKERLAAVEPPEEVGPSLESLAALLAHPGSADGARLAACCACVARWARAGAHRATAVGYAQAAALALPEDGEPALLAGVCAGEAGQPERAHTWLRRALAVARFSRQPAPYTGALLALAELYERAGHEGSARDCHQRAFRAARRARLPLERARAAYGLFRLALAGGDRARAAKFGRVAQLAARRVPPAERPYGLDLPSFWMEEGHPRRAGAVLAEMAPGLLSPAERLAAAVLRVRAAAADGSTEAVQAPWTDAWMLARERDAPGPQAAEALLQLAAAAAGLNDRQKVSRAGRAALAVVPAEGYDHALRMLAELGLGNGGKGRPAPTAEA